MTELTAPLRRLLSIVVVTLAALPALGQAPAQEAPKNLQVLPKDWTRAQVVAVMQNFNAALGVGCDHCHVQTQGAPPDFASDDKPEKAAARAMMKFTGEINTNLVAALERPAAELTRVGCITCHRGVPQPKQLSEILARTSAEKGFAAASAQYTELKTKYYGAQAYDFSESGLIATAQPLVPARADEAIQFLNLNLSLFPQSARTYVALANAQVAKQDTAGAIASLEKALAIEPNNAAARRQLDGLRR
jgi:tetratricopeptide (TPR) repeat protein